jgi:hypothetical protein
MSSVVSDAPCRNCGARLQGAFCHACGQKAASTHLGFHDVVHEATHELAHLDGKIFATLRTLLFKPGQLTKDFVEGRRARYVSPLRVYLTTSILFFFLLAVLPGAREKFRVTYTPDPGEDVPSAEELQRISEVVRTAFFTYLPRVIFVLMPAFAGLTWLFHRRRQPYFVAHLYYSVHLHAFAFLAFTLSLVLQYAGRFGALLAAPIPLWIAAYFGLSARRFFGAGESRLRSAWKALLIAVLYTVVILAALVGLVMFALQRTAIR